MVCVSKIMFRYEGEESGRGFFSFFFNDILEKDEKTRSLHGLYLLFSTEAAIYAAVFYFFFTFFAEHTLTSFYLKQVYQA